ARLRAAQACGDPQVGGSRSSTASMPRPGAAQPLRRHQTTMAYIQIGDILPRVGDFHRRLEEYYQEHAEDRADARWHCLLDLISRHDEAISQALTRYSEESESNVLLTWIQYDPQRRLDE